MKNRIVLNISPVEKEGKKEAAEMVRDAALLDMHDFRLPEIKGRLSNASVIHEPLPRIEGLGFDIYDYQMLFNDHETKRMIREGKTIGCFYIESPGMRSLLRRLDCDTFEMLTAVSSVIRPGVAESGMMREFVERHKDPARRKYLVPEMKKYLSETYGVMIYQEDVIKVAHHVAGLTLEEADLLRRAMSGKMRSHKAMQSISEKFFSSCRAKGYSNYAAKELWRQIESFAGYAFCKAHSASFALLSFQVAFLKVHYPAEFMAGVLSNNGGYYSPAVYIQESKRLGLKIVLPDINKCEYEYVGKNGAIRIGLMAVKSLSYNSAQKIIEERKANGKYVSLQDFLVRTHLACEETALLIKCGAMESLKKTRPSLMRLLDVYMFHRRALEENYNSLFAGERFQLEKEVETKVDYTIAEKCAIEYESFGYMASRHPLEFFGEYSNDRAVVRAADMHKHNNRKVKMIGWFMASKRIKTRKGEIMKFLSLEDLSGTFEAVIFPEAYVKYAERTMSMGPYLLEGKVDIDGGNNLIVEKLKVVSVKEMRSQTEWDSAENTWFGDVEKISEEEFGIVQTLGKEKLKQAYV